MGNGSPIDPANTGLGHRQVQRWNLPEGWVISARPAHPALVSEEDFIAVQGIRVARGSDPAGRYLLAGLLRCGICQRRMESCWANGRAAYRCRHGHTSATRPDPARPRNLYIREDHILPHMPALLIQLAGPGKPGTAQPAPATGGAEIACRLRASRITLTYDPQARTLRADTLEAVTVTIDRTC
jgi:site-specific DNA recombinase